MAYIPILKSGVTPTLPAKPQNAGKKDCYGAVFLGIDKYKVNNHWNLQGCVNDCHNVISTVRNKYNVDTVNDAKKLLDYEATKANTLNALRWMVNTYRRGIFTFSCHGSQIPDESEPDRKAEVLITTDHRWEDPLIDDEIKAIVEQMDECVIIADCCHAEGISRGGWIAKSVVCPEGVCMRLPRTVRNLAHVKELAACRSDQTASERYIDGKRQGVFTYTLCKILREHPGIALQDLQARLRAEIDGQTPVITGTGLLLEHAGISA